VSEPKRMLPPRKAKIIESKYLEHADLISWTLKFADSGMEQTYVWPSIDLLSCLNIKGKATPEILHKFCLDMTGKDINFVIDEEPNLPKASPVAEYQGLNDGLREYFGVSKKNVEGE